MFATINTSAPVSLWPFFVLAVSLVFIIVAISRWRIHPFIALIMAAILTGILSLELPGENKNHWVRAVELATEEFGKTAGIIGIAIGLACVIGVCLMESGAADKVVRRFLAVFGEKRAGIALLVSTYILSVPIFFDTMFMLMVPLAMALAMRTGKDYLLYVLAICCGGCITHCLTVPHPGPLAMVDILKLDVGFSILASLLGGIIPAIGGWYVAKWLNKKLNLPLRETPGLAWNDLKAIIAKPEHELPSFAFSIAPVLVPVVLISLTSFSKILGFHSAVIDFIGHKNIALLIGGALAMTLLARQRKMGMNQIGVVLEPPLATAAICILITSAGGAFGLMLRNAGVGQAIQGLATGHNFNLILLAYLISLVIRIAQGSATIAMLTTSSMIYPLLMATPPPYHTIYIYLSIGFGALSASWMNDSGFWVVSKLSGLTEKETLSSWTVLLTAISLIGLLTTLLFATILPLRGL